MKKVVIPVDFSEEAGNACAYIAAMSLSLELKVSLIHIYEPLVFLGDIPSEIVLADKEVVDALKSKLRREQYKMKSVNPGLAVNCVVRSGIYSDVLQSFMSEMNADLLVIGMGRTNRMLAHIFYGQAFNDEHNWTIPVLAIPKVFLYKPPDKVVVTRDHLPLPESFNILLDITSPFNVTYFVLKVRGQSEGHWYDIDEQLYRAEFYEMESNNIVKSVKSFVKAHYINLVVVAPRQHGFWHTLLFGRNSQKILLSAEVPVLII